MILTSSLAQMIKMTNLEELKKAFIVEKEYGEERIREHIERLLRYCKVDDEGRVYVESPKLTTKERVMLTLVARLLANKLEPKIIPELTIDEISESLEIPKNHIRARLRDLTKGGFAIRVKRGAYLASSYHVDKFIDQLDEKYGRGKQD